MVFPPPLRGRRGVGPRARADAAAGGGGGTVDASHLHESSRPLRLPNRPAPRQRGQPPSRRARGTPTHRRPTSVGIEARSASVRRAAPWSTTARRGPCMALDGCRKGPPIHPGWGRSARLFDNLVSQTGPSADGTAPRRGRLAPGGAPFPVATVRVARWRRARDAESVSAKQSQFAPGRGPPRGRRGRGRDWHLWHCRRSQEAAREGLVAMCRAVAAAGADPTGREREACERFCETKPIGRGPRPPTPATRPGPREHDTAKGFLRNKANSPRTKGIPPRSMHRPASGFGS